MEHKVLVNDDSGLWYVKEIEWSKSIIRSLRENYNSFVMYNMPKEQFELSKKRNFVSRGNTKKIVYPYPLIAGYRNDYKGRVGVNYSSGLKLSGEEFLGNFLILNDEIIYDPRLKFYEEQEARRYFYSDSSCGNATIFSDRTAVDLLEEEIRKREEPSFKNYEYSLYCGPYTEETGYTTANLVHKVTANELLSYATDKEKGYQLLKKIYKL